jgi:hypothetical protein
MKGPSNVLRNKIEESSDSSFLKKTALDLPEELKQQRKNQDETAAVIGRLLIWNAGVSIFALLLLSVESWKKAIFGEYRS